MTDDLPLVPPARLGALLTDQRTRRGLTIDELVVATELPFSADELRRIEQGQMPLSDDQVHRLMHAYEAQSGPVVPERSELVVDLQHGALLAGRKTKVLPADATFDEILGRYLSLLYLMRGIEPGRKLALRGDDLEVLSDALERNIAEINTGIKLLRSAEKSIRNDFFKERFQVKLILYQFFHLCKFFRHFDKLSTHVENRVQDHFLEDL